MLDLKSPFLTKLPTRLCRAAEYVYSFPFRGKWRISGSRTTELKFKNVESLLDHHFSNYSEASHTCRETLTAALMALNCRPACIIETGSSAWGTNSSLLFDSYVSSFGGRFETVDIRMSPSFKLYKQCCSNSIFFCDDSITFLKKWSKNNPDKKIDLLYLDSWDVNWYEPNRSSLHGLGEFLAISRNLKTGSLLLVDDTPLDALQLKNVQPELVEPFEEYFQRNCFYPGKGSLIKQLLKSVGRGHEISHKYQLLWQF